ncbi:aminotransferase-like domain-containing protein [Chitinophaga tropicalis]|uniref:Aminotransferase class I/II-fold pyridoxal phosphate-dependent enzyme n=1 Tax=Chitinophaga tropicalis TaxID=2683588 RepID=A0A7K1U1T0_9BACT|nr:PLP-dependent aminotransferase family protein [Chitinophaga tropicalis]MVT08236.1 aminotransferase class I/II-fold pyridoxal phosphate-dependent enzyme [Chitinophaga tropicalis]
MRSYRHVRLQLSLNDREPIYQQIKSYIINEIMRGRLLPGALLPGTRILAQQLKVNRNTVVLAYEHLTTAGWTVSRYKSGTHVNDSIPSGRMLPSGEGPPSTDISFRQFNFSHSHPSPAPYDIIFDDGLSDFKLAPVSEISREWRRIMLQNNHQELFSQPLRGNEQLLQEVNSMLNNDRGLAITPEHICITRGMQMALYLTAQTLLSPGDHVAVEQPGYQPAWHTFTTAGAQLHYIPSGFQGIDLEALERCCQSIPLKALYITPHHQYPATITLPDHKRVQLLELSRQYGFLIIEDDYDHEYHFGVQQLPLAAMSQNGNVIYLGSVIHSLPVNFVCGPPDFIASLAAYRTIIDREGDPILQQALANLMTAGDIRKHIHHTRSIYRQKLEHTSGIVQELFNGHVHYIQPEGGLAIWLQLHKPVAPELLLQKVRSAGINIADPLSYIPRHEDIPGIRLGYATLEQAQMMQGLNRLSKVIRQL